MNIQELIRLHYEAWIEAGKQTMPDLQDALCFLTEEVGEAMDTYMRLPGSPYFRHHPGSTTEEDVATELFDAIFMACVALDLIGADLMEVAQRKLAYGDAKRGLCYEPESEVFVQDIPSTLHPPITVADMCEDGVYELVEDWELTIKDIGPRDQADIDASYERRVAEDEQYAREHFTGSENDTEGDPSDQAKDDQTNETVHHHH